MKVAYSVCERQRDAACKTQHGAFAVRAFTDVAVEQEAAEAYAVESGWEDMAEEGRNKRFPVHSQGLLFPAVRVILIVKGDPVRVHRINAAVADCSAECIPCEVFHGIAFPVEGSLQEWQPLFAEEGINVLLPFIAITQFLP